MPVHYPHAAGKPYRPSNGTEGMIFEAKFCEQCSKMQPGDDDAEPCMIYGNAMFNSIGDPDYPAEWKYDGEGRPVCTSFEPDAD